ncbi:(4Fe-4S)-binding protein [Streptomyces chiangmaiensis]|uniref:(4Fe-4S)-binding protein n=1 Tax=Streptomyces chiangmaiensis TaxID=766497 RepID=A0ABU7FRM6_9ACTN|nr:(4Fe-4S)-binding protein [Streptomyces chiangmaiensis]MED7826402.1 (4Fe-4S)-binding protein [Streptomyces chiangmaiensis]
MGGRSEKKAYEGQSITVTYEARRCLHATECIRGLPEVFDTAKRPWIQPDAAAADHLAEVVRRCPSGALQYKFADGRTETPDRPTRIVRGSNGQLAMRGELSIDTAEGPRAETRAILCACGKSANQPYCDHSGLCGE